MADRRIMNELQIDPRIEDRRRRCALARSRIERAIEDGFAQEGLTRTEMLSVLAALVHARGSVAVAVEYAKLLEDM